MLGLTLGVRYPQERYLEIDDNLYVARYARAAMVAGSLSAWLQASGGEAWWTSRDSGAALRAQLGARTGMECAGRGCASRV